MKRCTYYLLAMLLTFVCQTVQAQTAQDALYIYRNDGGFNAFFFDDIDHFEYSRIDTLGVEHDDYVVQEVYALDSVFRIPITAIDSVAFVTPETEYKKDVIKAHPQISDYIIASDSLRWIRLSDKVPANMLPKKGDKWLIEGNCALLPGGFGGRVTSVESGNGGYTINTEALQPEEAFERVMLKMAIGTQDDAKTKTRGTPLWGSEEPIELEAIQGKASLTGSKDLINDMDIFSESFSPLGSIEYYIKPTLHARSFLSVDPLAGIHIDGYIGADANISYKGNVSGTLAARLDLPFPHKLAYFRKVLGEEGTPVYGKVLWKCGLFIEGAGSMELEANYSGTYRSMASLSYYKPALGSGKWTGDFDSGFDFDQYDMKKLTLGLSFSGGFMLEAAVECYNPLISGVSGIGIREELGRSLSFKIPLSITSDILTDTYYTDHTYDKLNIDDIVSFSPFIFANPYISAFGWQSTLFERKKFWELSAGIVPVISDCKVKANFIGEHLPGECTASYTLSRQLLLPVKVGYTMLDEWDDVVDSYWRPDTYWNVVSTKTVDHNFILDPIADNETSYTIFPTIQIPGGAPILCPEREEIIVKPAYFNFSDLKEFVLPAEERSLKLDHQDIDTNIPNVEISTDADWVTATWMPLNRSLMLRNKELPKDMDSRKCTLHIVGKNSKGKVLIEKDMSITQLRPVIYATPVVINANAEGGTFESTISKTSTVQNFEVSSSTNFLHPTLKDYVISIVVDPNTSSNEREGAIIVSGTTPDNQKAELKITVKQAAAGGNPDPGPEPGGDSPFKSINFWVDRTVKYVSDSNGTADTLVHVYPAFNFKAENSRFTMTEDKKIMHVVCQGYQEKEYNSEKSAATLSFDIDQTTNMVKNLVFSSNAESLQKFHILGYDINTTINAATNLSLGDFPLKTNTKTYKEGKWSVADGLKFNSFSLTADTYTTYTQTTEIVDVGYMPPVSDHLTYVPIGDTADYVWLVISMKEKEEEISLEWPDEETMNRLKSAGMPIHEGKAPPTVNGTYLMSPLSIVADHAGAEEEMGGVSGLVVKFSGQSVGQLDFDYYFILQGEDNIASGDTKALIQGDGSKFSVCVPWEESFFILSGEITGGEVSNMHCAIASKEQTSEYLILKDSDGRSTKTTWAPSPE